ncbi:hypothetical protein MVEN_00971400 [Mycena venus]|uniref:Uncharacterized protein n=1 Tax=Mycena venus TaxID=2733690 RepID=A0A8H6Y8N9_9AGAR|nr:hypothetical protein MVEN_00971400 [Mycena venus]
MTVFIIFVFISGWKWEPREELLEHICGHGGIGEGHESGLRLTRTISAHTACHHGYTSSFLPSTALRTILRTAPGLDRIFCMSFAVSVPSLTPSMSQTLFRNARPTPTSQLLPLEALMATTVSTQNTRWDWMRPIRQTESIQLMNTNLNSLAIIATFLAGGNALFFGGLFADVLSGTIAIVGAIQLQRTYTLLHQRESALTSLGDVLTPQPLKESEQDNLALMHHLRFLKMIVFRLLQNPRLWNELSSPLKQSADLVERTLRESELDDAHRITVVYSMADYRYTTNRLAQTAFRTSLGFAASLTVPWLVLAGLCSLTTGALSLVLSSQRIEVWVTSLAVLGGTIVLLIVLLVVIIGGDPRPVTAPFHDI